MAQIAPYVSRLLERFVADATAVLTKATNHYEAESNRCNICGHLGPLHGVTRNGLAVERARHHAVAAATQLHQFNRDRNLEALQERLRQLVSEAKQWKPQLPGAWSLLGCGPPLGPLAQTLLLISTSGLLHATALARTAYRQGYARAVQRDAVQRYDNLLAELSELETMRVASDWALVYTFDPTHLELSDAEPVTVKLTLAEGEVAATHISDERRARVMTGVALAAAAAEEADGAALARGVESTADAAAFELGMRRLLTARGTHEVEVDLAKVPRDRPCYVYQRLVTATAVVTAAAAGEGKVAGGAPTVGILGGILMRSEPLPETAVAV